MEDKPTALILYALPGETAGTVKDHIRALETLPTFRTCALNIAWQLPAKLNIDRFDVVLIHYSLMASEDAFDGPISLSPSSIMRIGKSSAIKCVFMQDEHRNIKKAINALRALGTDIFFTCTPPYLMERVYPKTELPSTTLVNVLTGYVNESLLHRSSKPYSDRPIDVGYRARKVAFWLGKLAQEKWSIADQFLGDARKFDLVCNISTREEDRLYGADWLRFLGDCKATLGTESGASVVDMDGSIRSKVDDAIHRNPELGFEEIENRFLSGVDGKISMAQISPRCFEAAAMKTLMILYEGHYSGRLEPWKHYVPLKKDHSNIAAVVEVLRDNTRAQAIIEAAYRDCALASQNRYSALQAVVENAVAGKMTCRSLADGYSDADWLDIKTDNQKIFERAHRLRAANATFSRFMTRILPASGTALRERVARPLRAILLRH